MNEREILDAEFKDAENHFSYSIKWWEKRRIIYNILLLGTELLIMLKYPEKTIRFGIKSAILETLLVNIVANIFYSTGLGVDIVMRYYFKKDSLNKLVRVVLFILGTLLSLRLVWIVYEGALGYYGAGY